MDIEGSRGDFMRYNAGEEVVLRGDLIDGVRYGVHKYVEGTPAVKGMETVLGKIVKIRDVKEGEYIIEGDKPWFVTDEMINHEETLILKEKSELKHYRSGLEDVLKNKSRNTTYQVVVRMKSSRLYRFKMDVSNLDDFLYVLCGGKIQAFVRIDNQVINADEIEHIEYFEV